MAEAEVEEELEATELMPDGEPKLAELREAGAVPVTEGPVWVNVPLSTTSKH